MSGVALVMISPSSSRMMRKTPCVEGCEGPMFRTIFSPWSSSNSSGRAERVAASGIWISVVIATVALLFPRLNRPRPIGLAVGFLDVMPPLQARIGRQRICFGNAYPRLAGNRVLPAGNGDERAAFERRRLGESHFRQLGGPSCQREILAQREIGIAFPHQNAAQVRMAAKTDAHHVVNLPFVPISRAPDANDAGCFPLFFTHLGLEAEIAKMPIAIKMIDQREARIIA